MGASIEERLLVLVLDNFEQVAAAAPVLNQLLARCANLRFLVTSRETLGLTGEFDYPIAPLPLPETGDVSAATNPSVTMFAQAVRASHPDFALNADTIEPVVAICRRLEGWPLALELAAARTAALPIQAVLARLDQRFNLLTGGPIDGEARFRSMRDTIAWSVNLLDADEAAALAQLSVFRGGFDLEAVEAVLVVPEQTRDVLTLIESLINKSMLRLESTSSAEPRYEMLETIRDYAAELLAADGDPNAVRERHASWVLELARIGRWRFKSEQTPLWIARFNADRDNLRGALTWLDESGRCELLLELAWSLAVYWDYQGELAEGRRWLERALKRLDDADAPFDHLPFAVSWLGWLLFRQGELDEAKRRFDDALQTWTSQGNVLGAAYVHASLGQVSQACGDLAGARRLFERSLQMFRDADEGPGIVEAMLNLSELDYQVGDKRQALDRAREALELAQTLETQTYVAVGLVAVAEALTATGDHDGGLIMAKRAFVKARELGFIVCAADAISSIAAVELARGELESAAKHLGLSWKWLSRTGSASFFFQHQFDRTLERAQQGLGQTRFERAWKAGLESPDSALDELIEQATAEEAPAGCGRPALTAREREVLSLLAAGMSDRQIADQLYITYRTANSYVARVLQKLSVPSRTAAATMAIREGLI
jgi:non-specific serine/threonine protein kinase